MKHKFKHRKFHRPTWMHWCHFLAELGTSHKRGGRKKAKIWWNPNWKKSIIKIAKVEEKCYEN